MAIDTSLILAAISAAGTSGAELAWFAPTGTTAPSDATTSLTAGTDEIQTVTITGSPTGGTFTLTYGGQTTAGIAYNAVASAVQTALVALTSVGTGNATVTGGPGPATPYVVTFKQQLGKTNVALMTASAASLTGGTTPAVTVVETTPGVSGWLSAGLISEDGVSKAVKDNTKDIRAFGVSGPVRKITTAEEVSIKVVMLETNRVSLAVYNRLPVSGVGSPTVTAGAVTITEGTFRAQRYAMVVDCIDGANKVRVYMPSVEVTDKGDQAFKAGEVISSDVTLTAYPGSDGVSASTFYLIPTLA